MKNKNPIFDFLKKCKRTFIYIGLFSGAVNLLMLVPTFYMLQLYDRVVTSKSGSTLLMLTLVLILLMTTMGSLDWVRSQLIVRLSARLDLSISPDLYRASFKKALENGGSSNSAQSLSDLQGLRQFLSGPGLIAFFDAPWLPIYIAVMFYMHPYLGFAGIICAFALITIMFITEISTSKELSRASAMEIKSKQSITRVFKNAEVIKSMGMFNKIFPLWQIKNTELLEVQTKINDKTTFFRSFSKFFRQLVQSLILGLGAYLVINDNVSGGIMIAGSILLGRALSPVDQMISAWKGIASAREKYIRISEMAENFHSTEKTRLPLPRGEISAEKISVSTHNSKINILDGVTFKIPPSTITAVIGSSGSGKTTLAKALVGVLPVTAGSLRIDGAEYSQWDMDDLGEYFGYLPQDMELFEGSIATNIARLGDFKSDDVINAAVLAGVHELILTLPNGYDTMINSAGAGLSGGQRQRIGLARAVYGNPKLVVLDEPNSNLDEEGEKQLAKTLLKLKEIGTCIVIITHKNSILNISDYLLVLNKGRSIAFGDVNYVVNQLNGNSKVLENQ